MGRETTQFYLIFWPELIGYWKFLEDPECFFKLFRTHGIYIFLVLCSNCYLNVY